MFIRRKVDIFNRCIMIFSHVMLFLLNNKQKNYTDIFLKFSSLNRSATQVKMLRNGDVVRPYLKRAKLAYQEDM